MFSYTNWNKYLTLQIKWSKSVHQPAAIVIPFFKSLATFCGSIWYNNASVLCFSSSRRRDVFFNSAVVSSNFFLQLYVNQKFKKNRTLSQFKMEKSMKTGKIKRYKSSKQVKITVIFLTWFSKENTESNLVI